ncbi:hypothetical protein EDC01DRAFT_665261 [Geopyxis carbonaria]|nr:hypothetical protein EDC01DRAFT_665261 [Geopyxis carbonaria]
MALFFIVIMIPCLFPITIYSSIPSTIENPQYAVVSTQTTNRTIPAFHFSFPLNSARPHPHPLFFLLNIPSQTNHATQHVLSKPSTTPSPPPSPNNNQPRTPGGKKA